ncbi:hypothetical protein BDZ97DRAFT_114503 [Flammula alnicola]|nr:hypothetical protein BDZ97DRAFT_114503 [Flammula alnicola]
MNAIDPMVYTLCVDSEGARYTPTRGAPSGRRPFIPRPAQPETPRYGGAHLATPLPAEDKGRIRASSPSSGGTVEMKKMMPFLEYHTYYINLGRSSTRPQVYGREQARLDVVHLRKFYTVVGPLSGYRCTQKLTSGGWNTWSAVAEDDGRECRHIERSSANFWPIYSPCEVEDSRRPIVAENRNGSRVGY